MDVVTIAISADEELGLRAIGVLAGSAPNGDKLVHELLRDGLTARLARYGLPWAPSVAHVETRVRATTPSPDALDASGPRFWTGRLAVALSGVLAVLGLVVLIGGYAGRWKWTGFTDNGQVWDWLQLVLLPVAFATLPLWLRHRDYMSDARRVGYAAVAAAFAVFVVLGYTLPIGWAGFTGNRLWDWLTLVLLPLTLIIVATWAETNWTVRTRHRVAIGCLAVGSVVTVIGGYEWHWTWTGFQGNTLWDWLQLMLLPIVFPTILGPALVRFVTGDAERRAREAGGRR